jgi:hypothetical protein
MTSSDTLKPLAEPLAAVQRLIEQLNHQGVVIGGVAASLLGQPRLTADADVLILASIDDIPRVLELAGAEGLQPRTANVVEFARRSRVVLLRHAASGIDVDISLGVLPFEIEAVERSHEHQAGALRIRLPTPEDLIILKAVAHRPKDLVDIAAVIGVHRQLDVARIRFWVQQFADLLEQPELWTDVEMLLREAK